MKVRALKYFIIASIAGVCYSNPLSAQEGGFMFDDDGQQEKIETPSVPGSEKVYKPNTGGSGNSEKKTAKQHEVAPQKEGTTSAKTESKKPAGKEPTSNPAIDTTNKEEDPDSILSFNFLHYIIQRYKFSDVIDQ